MSRIEKSCEVDVPVSTAYDQWTQFEDFPLFMDGIESVRQLDDKRLQWQAQIAGKSLEWTAEITEQAPDRAIAWRSTSGAQNEGVVRFEPLGPNRCRVSLSLTVHPETFGEKVGNALGATSSKVTGDLNRFKQFIESRRAPSGAWRGEIHEGELTHGDENGPQVR